MPESGLQKARSLDRWNPALCGRHDYHPTHGFYMRVLWLFVNMEAGIISGKD